MNRQKAIQKRQGFVIASLHEISKVRSLANLNRSQALERAKEMQAEMTENIAPFLVWQQAINKLVKELE